MIKHKKLFAVITAFIMMFTFTFASFAAVGTETNKDSYTTVSPLEKFFYNIFESVIEVAVEAIASVFPVPEEWENEVSDVSPEGTEVFLDSPSENAVWSMGYSSRSILLNDDETIGKLYVGGSIELGDKYATEIYDDLRVRTVALSDGSGRGISVIAAVDCYSLSLRDVREIRSRLDSYAKEKGINSITVVALHQHSAIDTFGMNGNILKMILVNPMNALKGNKQENGKSQKYMENLFDKCRETIIEATENMTEGKMYIGTADASKYTRDKRQPYVNDPNFNRLRFVPENGEKETWIVTSPIHCVGNGAGGTAVTGDYPYYAEKEIGERANIMFVLGAEQANTQERNSSTVIGYTDNMTGIELTAGYGKAIGSDIASITAEEEVSPLFNIAYKQISLSVDNPILLLGGKTGLFENIICKSDSEYKAVTEIGYIEMGDSLAFAVIPGELAPEIAYSGCLNGDYSWTGEDWIYPSLQETVTENAGERDLHILGLANDQIGYIVPDNDYIPMIHENSKSIEFVSLGKNTASAIVSEFSSLVLSK